MAERCGEESCERTAAARSSRRAGHSSGNQSLSSPAEPARTALHRPLGCLKHPDGVAQFRCAFIELARDRAFHLALHNFEFSQRPLGPDLVQPFFQESDFTALTRQFGEVGTLEEFDNGIATLLDFMHAITKLSFV